MTDDETVLRNELAEAAGRAIYKAADDMTYPGTEGLVIADELLPIVQRHIDQARADALHACPGLDMPNPGRYVACYLSGHRCQTVTQITEDEWGIRQRVVCECCGEFYGSMGVPWSMAEEWRQS